MVGIWLPMRTLATEPPATAEPATATVPLGVSSYVLSGETQLLAGAVLNTQTLVLVSRSSPGPSVASCATETASAVSQLCGSPCRICDTRGSEADKQWRKDTCEEAWARVEETSEFGDMPSVCAAKDRVEVAVLVLGQDGTAKKSHAFELGVRGCDTRVRSMSLSDVDQDGNEELIVRTHALSDDLWAEANTVDRLTILTVPELEVQFDEIVGMQPHSDEGDQYRTVVVDPRFEDADGDGHLDLILEGMSYEGACKVDPRGWPLPQDQQADADSNDEEEEGPRPCSHLKKYSRTQKSLPDSDRFEAIAEEDALFW